MEYERKKSLDKRNENVLRPDFEEHMMKISYNLFTQF